MFQLNGALGLGRWKKRCTLCVSWVHIHCRHRHLLEGSALFFSGNNVGHPGMQ